MLPLPAAIVAVLQPFACLFTHPTWRHAQVLLVGTLLAQGPRTVTAALRAMGLSGERRFERYHRVFNRARWSGLRGGQILLGLLVWLVPQGWPLVVAICLALVRRQIWAENNYANSTSEQEPVLISPQHLERLLNQVAATA